MTSIDLARINPVTSPIVDVLTEGKKAAGAVVSPLVQSIVNQVYGQDAFTQMPHRVEGSTAKADVPFLSLDTVEIFLNDNLSTNFGYRELVESRTGGRTQSDDSLLWHLEPITYKTAESQQKELERIRRRQAEHPLADWFPLFIPVEDNTRDIIKQRQREAGTVEGKPGVIDPDAIRGQLKIDASEIDIEGIRRQLQGAR